MSRNQRSNGNRNSRSSQSRDTGKKKTGCTAGIGKDGNPYTQGWNASKRFGLVKFLAVHYKGTSVHTSKTGIDWENVMVKIQKPFEKESIVSGLREVRTGKVIIKDLGLVMNPKAPNGGYCGKF